MRIKTNRQKTYFISKPQKKGKLAGKEDKLFSAIALSSVHHNKNLLLCPDFTSLQAIPCIEIYENYLCNIQSVLACYLYLYITTLLNQLKVGRSHDYINVGRGAAEGGEGRKKNQWHLVIAYCSIILCTDIDNTYVYICCD